MAYPDHYLFSFGGTMCAGREVWSNNVRFWAGGDVVIEAGTAEESALTKLEADLRTLAGDSASRWHTDTKVEWLKFNRIDATGRYESATESNTRFLSGTSIFGGTSSVSPSAPQLAVAITFRTELDRGPASVGRIFAPRPAVDNSVEGVIPAAQVTAMVGAYKTWIQSMGNWPGIDLNSVAPAVVSGVGAGKASYIRAVEVGNVMDTQRRRRNALPEVRTRLAVPDPR